MLPDSIALRIEILMKAGHPIEKALELAIDEETTMICSLLNGSGYLSKKGHLVADIIGKEVYKKHNSIS